jgi:MoaA/NifB/PqqE/SkfB family radical SAM enzyme
MHQVLRTARVALDVAAAALDRDRPLITHLIVTRRCNLSCSYCFEYDKVSEPVPLDVLEQRIDHLARLRSVFVTLTGGESLLHPQLVEVVRHVCQRGMTPFLNTNGFLLTKDIVLALNDAGLYGMQLSIDNARPNETSKKSLKTLDPKLRLLSRHARFHVRINTVIGTAAPEEALQVARAVMGMGFHSNISLVRQESGAIAAPSPATRAVYDQIRALGRGRLPSFMDDSYTQTLLEHGEMSWKCRAGARTFLVDEHGFTHLCQPRRGTPGKPIADYTVDDIRRAFDAPKPCARTCPIAFAHHASKFDGWRPQRGGSVVEAPSSTGRRSPALAVIG